MRKLIALTILLLSVPLHAGGRADSLLIQQEGLIQQVISQTSSDSLMLQVRILSGELPAAISGSTYTIASRHRLQPGNALAAAYIMQELERHGLSPFLHRFNTQGENVIAIQTGSVFPEKQFMICAHYDAMPAGNLAPGADDNASGTAAVLEAARLLGRRQLPYTVVYALWDEEEAGLLGSRAYAELAALQAHQILGVINMDMIAYDGNGDSIVTLHVRPVAQTLDLGQRLFDINANYQVGLDLHFVNPGSGASDHAAFWEKNYSALLVIEDYRRSSSVYDFNPWYHTVNDRIETAGTTLFNTPYYLRCSQMSIASLFSYAFDVAPAAPQLLANAPELPVRTLLKWHASAKTRDYTVELSRDPRFLTSDLRLEAVGDSFCVPGRLAYQQQYFWRVRSRNRGGSGAWSLPQDFTTRGPQHHVVTLQPGWNLVSSSVAPDDSTLSALLSTPKIILRDDAGRRYAPALAWEERTVWSSSEGFWLHAADSSSVVFKGWEINSAPAPLPLRAGWQIMPYWQTASLPVDSALASIGPSVGMMKDELGRLYWPAEGIDEISRLEPDRAYQIYLTAADTLLLPLNEPTLGKAKPAFSPEVMPLRHYEPISSTGITAHLLLDAQGLEEGEEVGVWAKGNLLVGAGRVVQGRALISIWGDDIATIGSVDGALAGDALNVTAWSEAFNAERAVLLDEAAEVWSGPASALPLTFSTDAVWRGRIGAVEELPAAFVLRQNYPNPFNGATSLRYTLPRESRVMLRVVNLQGQEVARLADGVQRAGIYVVNFAAKEMASGLYWAELRSETSIARVKMMLVR